MSRSSHAFLPIQEPRCFDAQCKVRQDCTRWVRRNDQGFPIIRAATMRKGWEVREEFCGNALVVVRYP